MFAAAFYSLHPSEGTAVSTQLEVWRTGNSRKWSRIVDNLEAETGLSQTVFAAVLTTFAGHLQAGNSAPEAWIISCRLHQFQGRLLTQPLPARLGRAATLSQYAGVVSSSTSASLTDTQAAELIRKVVLAGDSPSPRELRILRNAKLGKYVIWATYNENHPSDNPFHHLPQTIEDVRTALGLGECPVTETLVLLSYSTSFPDSTVLKLFRPTVCDAADYSHYRPHPDPAAVCGRTYPLPPNPAAYQGQPEVVHREISGATLALPLYLTR